MRSLLLCLLPTLLFAVPRVSSGGKDSLTLHAAGQRLRLDTLVRGLNHPWGMAWWNGEDRPKLLISERNGGLWLFDQQTLWELTPLPTHVYSRGQGGWLDLAVDTEGLVFLSYARQVGESSATALARFRIVREAKRYRIREWTEIFSATPPQNSQVHFGGAIALSEDALYLSLGERGNRSQAQNPGNHLGSIVKLSLDGQPAPSPFASRGGRDGVFSIGHRNIQGLVWLAGRHALLASEHGPRGGDEINLILPGRNYGWPVISHGREYRDNAVIGEGSHKEGMEQPLQHWSPSPAFAGMAYYSKEHAARGMKQWAEHLLVASLAAKSLYALPLSPQGDRLGQPQEKLTLPWRLRQVKVGSDGKVYLLSDEDEGRLLLLGRA